MAGGCFGPWLAPCILTIVWENSGIWKLRFYEAKDSQGIQPLQAEVPGGTQPPHPGAPGHIMRPSMLEVTVGLLGGGFTCVYCVRDSQRPRDPGHPEKV